MSEKYGKVCSIPIQCACGYIDPYAKHGGIPVVMRWCGACGAAICPDCWPKENKDDAVTCKCRKCLDAKRPLMSEIAGMEESFKREKRILAAILK